MTRLNMLTSKIKSIHFMAVCGTAMANLAVRLKDLGYDVTGSDENFYPPMSTFLEKNKLAISPYFSENNIKYNPDLVIVGNAVVRGNPEAEYMLEHKLHYMSFPEALKEFFLRDKQNIVVTGTHGKTTSTSLLAWTLETAQFNPGFLIGGIPENFGFGFQLGQGKQFVLEGDEYDSAFFDKRSKFLHYLPEIIIINNIEFDHADIFRDIEDIKQSFRHLVKLIPRNGLIVANGDDPIVREIIQNSFAPVEIFGFNKEGNWQINAVEYLGNGVRFSLTNNCAQFGRFFLPLAGNFNIMNATGVIAVLNHLNVGIDKIQQGFNSFRNVRRRLEIRGTVNGMTVYDDFAHHPTAVRETLAGLHRKLPQSRIWAIFEPRTNTTTRNFFQNEMAACFREAFGVAIGKINRPHRFKPEERLDREKLRDDLTNMKKPAFYSDSVEEIITWLLPQLLPGDQVVIMSNGEFDNIHEKLLERLRKEGQRS